MLETIVSRIFQCHSKARAKAKGRHDAPHGQPAGTRKLLRGRGLPTKASPRAAQQTPEATKERAIVRLGSKMECYKTRTGSSRVFENSAASGLGKIKV